MLAVTPPISTDPTILHLEITHKWATVEAHVRETFLIPLGKYFGFEERLRTFMMGAVILTDLPRKKRVSRWRVFCWRKEACIAMLTWIGASLFFGHRGRPSDGFPG